MAIGVIGIFLFGLIILALIGVIAIADRWTKRSAPEGDPFWDRSFSTAAELLGLEHRLDRKSVMRGEIDGHRVTVSGYQGQPPEIEVRFRSGLSSVEISPRVGRASNRPELSLLDPEFEMQFAVRTSGEVAEESAIHQWLTIERRDAIALLSEGLDIDEIEEDELEVKMRRDSWNPNELVKAVRLCVYAAKTLDESYSPDDALAADTGPQDQIEFDDSSSQDAIRPSDREG